MDRSPKASPKIRGKISSLPTNIHEGQQEKLDNNSCCHVVRDVDVQQTLFVSWRTKSTGGALQGAGENHTNDIVR